MTQSRDNTLTYAYATFFYFSSAHLSHPWPHALLDIPWSRSCKSTTTTHPWVHHSSANPSLISFPSLLYIPLFLFTLVYSPSHLPTLNFWSCLCAHLDALLHLWCLLSPLPPLLLLPCPSSSQRWRQQPLMQHRPRIPPACPTTPPYPWLRRCPFETISLLKHERNSCRKCVSRWWRSERFTLRTTASPPHSLQGPCRLFKTTSRCHSRRRRRWWLVTAAITEAINSLVSLRGLSLSLYC